MACRPSVSCCKILASRWNPRVLCHLGLLRSSHLMGLRLYFHSNVSKQRNYVKKSADREVRTGSVALPHRFSSSFSGLGCTSTLTSRNVSSLDGVRPLVLCNCHPWPFCLRWCILQGHICRSIWLCASRDDLGWGRNWCVLGWWMRWLGPALLRWWGRNEHVHHLAEFHHLQGWW